MYADRSHAGRLLALSLKHYAGRSDVQVLALPRGGVPVGAEVARVLGVPLDVFVVRKLGVPGREELAMGAIASGGVLVVNEEVAGQFAIPPSVFDEAAGTARVELDRREALYRGDQPALDLHDKTAILVDDGLATGSTMRAAVKAVRKLGPARVVVAVPVGAAETCSEFRILADEVVCLMTPDPFYAVGSWYEDFSQTTDEEVREMLARSCPNPDESES